MQAMVRGKQARAEVEAKKEAESARVIQEAMREALMAGVIEPPAAAAEVVAPPGVNTKLVLVAGSAEDKE
eukprot:2969544-Prymnesium_polylepis.1